MNHTFSVDRMEKKYCLTPVQKSLLYHRLSQVMELDGNGTQGGYLVRSVYFDSIYDNDYFDKVNGVEIRKKIRLRIYRPDQESVKLELKQKWGAAQRKKTMWIPRSLAEDMLCGEYGGLSGLGEALSDEIYSILELGAYRPKCIIEYHRAAFTERSNDIRITFDSDIRASASCGGFFRPDLSMLPLLNEPVLEVKYNGFLLSNIKQILDLADSSETSVSKYAMSRNLFL